MKSNKFLDRQVQDSLRGERDGVQTLVNKEKRRNVTEDYLAKLSLDDALAEMSPLQQEVPSDEDEEHERRMQEEDDWVFMNGGCNSMGMFLTDYI